jgi:hypothetical protein
MTIKQTGNRKDNQKNSGTPERPGLLHHYAPSRSGNVAKALLQGNCGVVQTDGYTGYDFLDHCADIQHDLATIKWSPS